MITKELIKKKFSNKKGNLNTNKIKLSKNKIYLNFIFKETSFLNIETKLKFRFKYFINNLKSVKRCKTCQKSLENIDKNYCSAICANKNTETISKIKQTWSDKDKNTINEIQKKRKCTNIKKYGVDIASKHPDVIAKNKTTHFINWDGDFAMNNSSVSEKRLKTCMELYGGVGMQSEYLFNKIKQTNIKNYSNEYFSQSEEWYRKCVATSIKRYGEIWPAKSDKINVKMQGGGFSYHSFTFPSGKKVNTQGYEKYILLELLKKYNENDIIVGLKNILNEIGIIKYDYENKTRRYYPDIYIKSENLIIEVKSDYYYFKELDKNLLKRDAILKRGINFIFIVLNKQKQQIKI